MIVGISAPPPELSERVFVFTWLGILGGFLALCVTLALYFFHYLLQH